MPNAKNIILLCEDDAQEQFIVKCLERFGATNLKHRLVRINASREIHGGNVGFVEERAVPETIAWEAKNRRTRTLLVIAADADATCSREQRRNRLPRIYNSALFVVIIPKRNIETWIKLGQEPDPVKAILSDQLDYKSPDCSCAPAPRQAAEVLCDTLLRHGAFTSGNGVIFDCFSDLTLLRNGVTALNSYDRHQSGS